MEKLNKGKWVTTILSGPFSDAPPKYVLGAPARREWEEQVPEGRL